MHAEPQGIDIVGPRYTVHVAARVLSGSMWTFCEADELLKDAELSDVGDARDIELGTASQSNFPVFLKSC